jgi:hypothetical protein
MTVEDLLAQHHHLVAKQDLLKGQLRKLRDKLRANRAELWMRGIVPGTSESLHRGDRQAR